MRSYCRDDGAFAVQDSNGDKVLFLFEEEDDAERYKLMLQDLEIDVDHKMDIIEVDFPISDDVIRAFIHGFNPSDEPLIVEVICGFNTDAFLRLEH